MARGGGVHHGWGGLEANWHTHVPYPYPIHGGWIRDGGVHLGWRGGGTGLGGFFFFSSDKCLLFAVSSSSLHTSGQQGRESIPIHTIQTGSRNPHTIPYPIPPPLPIPTIIDGRAEAIPSYPIFDGGIDGRWGMMGMMGQMGWMPGVAGTQKSKLGCTRASSSLLLLRGWLRRWLQVLFKYLPPKALHLAPPPLDPPTYPASHPGGLTAFLQATSSSK